MKLCQFTDLLHSHPTKPFHLVLPGESSVPLSFHITEVGHVVKKFVDCSGRVHTVQHCQLQAWVGKDTQHRLLAGKMAGVVEIARTKGVLPMDDLDVEIEYEGTLLSQYAITGYTVTENAVILNLAAKHTDCLAKDVCLPSLPMAAGACCGPSGCC